MILLPPHLECWDDSWVPLCQPPDHPVPTLLWTVSTTQRSCGCRQLRIPLGRGLSCIGFCSSTRCHSAAEVYVTSLPPKNHPSINSRSLAISLWVLIFRNIQKFLMKCSQGRESLYLPGGPGIPGLPGLPCWPCCPSGHIIPGVPGGPGKPFGPKQEQIKQSFNCTKRKTIRKNNNNKKDFEMSVLSLEYVNFMEVERFAIISYRITFCNQCSR